LIICIFCCFIQIIYKDVRIRETDNLYYLFINKQNWLMKRLAATARIFIQVRFLY